MVTPYHFQKPHFTFVDRVETTAARGKSLTFDDVNRFKSQLIAAYQAPCKQYQAGMGSKGKLIDSLESLLAPKFNTSKNKIRIGEWKPYLNNTFDFWDLVPAYLGLQSQNYLPKEKQIEKDQYQYMSGHESLYILAGINDKLPGGFCIEKMPNYISLHDMEFSDIAALAIRAGCSRMFKSHNKEHGRANRGRQTYNSEAEFPFYKSILGSENKPRIPTITQIREKYSPQQQLF